ncbi:MAG: MFS transporter [Proteobacteria bacterium]|nr:MFS transporter [Pseudomonadota bacterium]
MIATLGYAVDLFDLILFSLLRVQSLKDLNVADITGVGVDLINAQMAGLMVGGVFWGVLGDKRGRLSVLLGSILLYSVANLGNAFVTTVPQYAAMRFIAGIGLAGELGAGVTIVSEILPQRIRGYGSTIITAIGVFGAVGAAYVANTVPWRHAYILGGVLGIVLLAMRLGIRESHLFSKLESSSVSRGELRAFLRRPDMIRRVGLVVLTGVPIWFVIGVLVTFTPEFAKALNIPGEQPKVTNAIMFLYLGLSVGGAGVGVLSQWLQSRRHALLASLLATSALLVFYRPLAGASMTAYYAMCFAFGVSAGYWAMFVQIAAEQFGTNFRATVTTSVPNLVRGSTIPMTMAFKGLIPGLGVIGSGLTVGFTVLGIAILATWLLEETFHRELDYYERV